MLWLFEDREALFDVLATGTGARMHASAIAPGGVRSIGTTHTSRELIDVLTVLGARMDILTASVLTHRAWTSRLHGVGVLTDGGS